MQYMINYKFGHVVLIDFLQPDGNKKKRPALVILDIGDSDVVVVPITTKERKGMGDYKIKNWQDSGLLLASWMRLAKVSCLARNDVNRSLGSITNYDKRKIISLWKEIYRLT